ncbi:hypothetical protein PSTT_15454 [Puccinia striiformis]|uniref:Uncharacterized protein n=1 Tax=Puccinia striiformis TaxID=27350 RepID=A0A2S4UHT6_9BASI|nr:hypothetical protein PSTT_15454 [Puccinia striiformis]
MLLLTNKVNQVYQPLQNIPISILIRNTSHLTGSIQQARSLLRSTSWTASSGPLSRLIPL